MPAPPSCMSGDPFACDAAGPKDGDLAFGHGLPRLRAQGHAGDEGDGLIGCGHGQPVGGDGRAG